MEVKIKLLPGGRKPEKKTEGAAAFDCYARESVLVSSSGSRLIGLGFALELPPGYHAKIFPRSSIGLKTVLRQPNCCGVIDADYRGEVKAMYEVRPLEKRDVSVIGEGIKRVDATGNVIDTMYEVEYYPQSYLVRAGERIAQMLIEKTENVTFVEATELSETERGDGGFGSTGK